MKSLRIPNPLDAFALITTGLVYWLAIAPVARRELRGWQHYAQSIPNPMLRRLALAKLSAEALNPEAAAFFAVLAPRRNRRDLIRLIVAYQVMYDYLDAVNEEPVFSSLHDGLQLHRALIDPMLSEAMFTDYYADHPEYDDGGYLQILLRTCRKTLHELPATEAVVPTLITAAVRCGEAQAHNHVPPIEDHNELTDWSEKQAPGSGYLWWELAAGGISCLAIHALFAAAATPETTSIEGQNLDAAYFPPICSISALLDSLIDLPHDANTTNHSFAAHYLSSSQAAIRYSAIIADAEKRLSRLRYARRHQTILAGIAGYYLSAPEAHQGFARPVTASVIEAAEPQIGLILAIMRLRRMQHSSSLFNNEPE